MITIIYHESFLTVSEKDLFENQLSLEIRFCLAPDGRIIDCNQNGDIMVRQFGHSFYDFFTKDAVIEAKAFLNAIQKEPDIVSALLHDRMNDRDMGIYYNGFFKNGKIYLAGYRTDPLKRAAAEFAHELRNPLTVIKGFVQLSTYTQEFDKYNRTILSEIDRMYGILDNFLKLTRKKINMKKMLPDKLCMALIAFISSECLVKKVTFDYDIAFSVNVCNVDLSMIKQVILNMLRNALEAVEGKEGTEKKIFFRGSVEDSGYRISLTDNGPGIENHLLKQVGRPFFSTKENGTGVGLSLCKKIITEHHGSFCLSSMPGKGTTASFSLPFAD
ncbi:HAMP domain-containing sensor histidine kinase [Sporolactobacillus sp. Y61]|uniref:histidine kinase n=1 Tax=Sporolactobacillus sp. Y61 TaxID=3160863 RepID=A0AAU8IE84_9BACL